MADKRELQSPLDRLTFLAEVSDVLASSLDYDQTLQRVAELVVPRLADWCAVDLVSGDGGISNVAVAHVDPGKVELARSLRDRYPPDLAAPHGVPAVIRTSRAELHATISDEQLRGESADAGHLDLLRRLELRSLVIAPLVARGRTLGAISLVQSNAGRAFDASDLLLAEELGLRAGLAIDNARLHTAERRAMARSALLQDLTAGLASALTTADACDVILHRGLTAMGASSGLVGLVDEAGGSVRVARWFGYVSEETDDLGWWESFPLDRAFPLSAAILDREPVILPDVATRDERFPALRASRIVRDHALVCLPMVAGGASVGGLAASFAGPRTFDGDDLSLMGAIATQSAVALERARLYEAERAAREAAEVARLRLSLLSRASRLLAASLDPETAFERLAALVVRELADICLIDVASEDGSIQRMAAAHADPARQPLVDRLRAQFPPLAEGRHPVAEVIRSGVAAHATEMSEEFLRATTRDGEHLDIVRQLGFRSFICVPLSARGRILGTMTFVSCRANRRYDEEDLELAIEMGRRAAVNIDNARMFQERDRIARSLQDVLLPRSLPRIPGFELAASYQPGGEGMLVGGDFYDVFERPDGSFGLAIGDVCGKGADAAALMGVARQTISVAGMSESRPSAILSTLNEVLLRGGYGPFVTVCDVRVRPDDGGARLTVCSGGHPLPLLVAADGSVREVGTPGTLLGVVREPSLTDVAVDLRPGEALVMYTDGVTEWHPGRRVEQEFLALLASHACRTAAETAAAIRAWRDEGIGSMASDDAAVLIIHALDAAARGDEEALPSGDPPG